MRKLITQTPLLAEYGSGSAMAWNTQTPRCKVVKARMKPGWVTMLWCGHLPWQLSSVGDPLCWRMSSTKSPLCVFTFKWVIPPCHSKNLLVLVEIRILESLPFITTYIKLIRMFRHEILVDKHLDFKYDKLGLNSAKFRSNYIHTRLHDNGSHFQTFCQAQPNPQLSWAEWLYFQLIQPPPPTPTPTRESLFHSQYLSHHS